MCRGRRISPGVSQLWQAITVGSFLIPMNTWVPFSEILICEQDWRSVTAALSSCDLNELLSLSVPQFSYLLNGLANALQLRTIRNTLLENEVDLVDCSNEGNSILQRARRHFGKKVLGGGCCRIRTPIRWFGREFKEVWFSLVAVAQRAGIPGLHPGPRKGWPLLPSTA